MQTRRRKNSLKESSTAKPSEEVVAKNGREEEGEEEQEEVVKVKVEDELEENANPVASTSQPSSMPTLPSTSTASCGSKSKKTSSEVEGEAMMSEGVPVASGTSSSSSQPMAIGEPVRIPLAQMQIKLDIDDLMIADTALPFYRLSPPASTQDYRFNLAHNEGISDLFF